MRSSDMLDTVGVMLFSIIGIAGIIGIVFLVQCQATGPCAWKGGVTSTAQDYTYCGNGTRIIFNHDNSSATATYEIRQR